MKLVAMEKPEQNRAVFDPWTVVHFASGLAAGLVGMRRDWSISAAIAYEVAEQYAERQRWGQDFFETSRHESLSNAAADVAIFALGHWLGEAWNATGSRRPT
jgi:hypothetical protein